MKFDRYGVVFGFAILLIFFFCYRFSIVDVSVLRSLPMFEIFVGNKYKKNISFRVNRIESTSPLSFIKLAKTQESVLFPKKLNKIHKTMTSILAERYSSFL